MGARDEATAVPLGAKPNEVQAALTAGELIERHRATPKKAEYLHGKPYVILRGADGGEQLVYVDAQAKKPTFRQGAVALADAPSFIDYFNRHETAASAIYATIDPCNFVAVLDEHPDHQTSDPEWREFRATFTPALSKEWVTWLGRNGHKSAFPSTEEFAYFIEDNAPDFVNPESAALMDIALNFRASQSVSYKAAQRLQDGNVELQYSNIVNGAASGATGSVRIPETFTISIPLFAGPSAIPYEVEARLRYRIHGGNLSIWYDLVRPHKVLERGFKDLYTEVADGTKRTLLLGRTD